MKVLTGRKASKYSLQSNLFSYTSIKLRLKAELKVQGVGFSEFGVSHGFKFSGFWEIGPSTLSKMIPLALSEESFR